MADTHYLQFQTIPNALGAATSAVIPADRLPPHN